MHIEGDIEYFGCGCYTVVDLMTGEGKVRYLCDKHRTTAWHNVEKGR